MTASANSFLARMSASVSQCLYCSDDGSDAGSESSSGAVALNNGCSCAGSIPFGLALALRPKLRE